MCKLIGCEAQEGAEYKLTCNVQDLKPAQNAYVYMFHILYIIAVLRLEENMVI